MNSSTAKHFKAIGHGNDRNLVNAADQIVPSRIAKRESQSHRATRRTIGSRWLCDLFQSTKRGLLWWAVRLDKSGHCKVRQPPCERPVQ